MKPSWPSVNRRSPRLILSRPKETRSSSGPSPGAPSGRQSRGWPSSLAPCLEDAIALILLGLPVEPIAMVAISHPASPRRPHPGHRRPRHISAVRRSGRGSPCPFAPPRQKARAPPPSGWGLGHRTGTWWVEDWSADGSRNPPDASCATRCRYTWPPQAPSLETLGRGPAGPRSGAWGCSTDAWTWLKPMAGRRGILAPGHRRRQPDGRRPHAAPAISAAASTSTATRWDLRNRRMNRHGPRKPGLLPITPQNGPSFGPCWRLTALESDKAHQREHPDIPCAQPSLSLPPCQPRAAVLVRQFYPGAGAESDHPAHRPVLLALGLGTPDPAPPRAAATEGPVGTAPPASVDPVTARGVGGDQLQHLRLPGAANHDGHQCGAHGFDHAGADRDPVVSAAPAAG